MLHRLFRTVSVSKDSDDNYTRLLLEPEAWCPIPLGESQVRVLFCQDAGDSNKTILYDSSHGIAASPVIPVNSKRGTATTTQGGMARSWNGSDVFLSKTASSRGNSSLLGSLTDRRSDCARPSSMRTQPSFATYDSRGSPSSPNRHHRQASRRLDLIGDMIFGTAPLAYKGMNTKVHYKRDKEPQIVLSKLFTINPQDADVTRRTSFSSINSDWSTTSSIAAGCGISANTNTVAGLEHGAKRSTSTMSVRSISLDDNASELSSDDDRSHYSGYSVYPPVLGLRSSSKASFNSKRSRRFSQTSMEDGVFRPMPMPGGGIQSPSDHSDSNIGSITPASQHSVRTIKYALAVVITLDDKNKALFDFVFSHFSLIENHLHRLQAEAFELLCDHFRTNNFSNHHPLQQNRRSRGHLSYLESGIFQHDKTMIDAVMQFKRAFYDLYSVPRIQEPLWLNMSTFPQRKSDYAASLVKELIYLIDQYDTDSNHHFISTLVTAVLMYHLSWVQTVAPPDEVKNINCRHGNYDPLWAQLSDLYGFVASPGRIARTIVVGQKSGLVRRILYILTYLIRCNEVYENVESMICPDSESIFSFEREKDVTDVSKLEDKIVKQLIGTTTDVESIAIPKAAAHISSSSNEALNYHHPTASPDSLNDNISSVSYSSAVNTSTGTNRWSSSGSFDQPKSSTSSSTDQHHPSRSSTSLTDEQRNGYGEQPQPQQQQQQSQQSPQRQHSLDEVVSANGIYSVMMPKSSIYRMTPDITQVREDGIPTDPVHHLFAKSYGRSLMGTYCDTYKSDFVLLGVSNGSFIDRLEADMRHTLPQFALTDEVTEAACLVIDAEKSRCRILRQRISQVVSSDINNGESTANWKDVNCSNIVRQLLSNVKQKHTSGASPDEIVDSIEDGLQLIYLQSLLLQERLFEWLDSTGTEPLEDLKDIAEDIKVEISDIPLLVNVCSTYDSRVAEILREA